MMRVLLIWLCLAMPAFAQDNAVIEADAREIGEGLRCVVCQNQSIYESDAPLAADMRQLVRTRLEAGDTQDEIFALMVDRYGDYVLLKPPVQSNTALLWAGPFLLLLVGLTWFLLGGKRSENET